MRKSGTHSARILPKRSVGKRGKRKKDARIPLIAFCALGAGILAAGYGITYQRTPEARASAVAPSIAAPQEAKEIAGSTGGDTPISEQALRKEDRLITGAIPKREEIALPVINPKARPEATKKKKSTVAKVQSPTSVADDIKPEAQQKR